jgi:hypothetical protein
MHGSMCTVSLRGLPLVLSHPPFTLLFSCDTRLCSSSSYSLNNQLLTCCSHSTVPELHHKRQCRISDLFFFSPLSPFSLIIVCVSPRLGGLGFLCRPCGGADISDSRFGAVRGIKDTCCKQWAIKRARKIG